MCNHKRKGRVTNQAYGYDKNRPHASVVVCDRPDCIAKAKSWVAGRTNETAHYVADAPEMARLDL